MASPTGGQVKPQKLITCYILNEITNEKIVFPTLPEDVSESYSATWESTDIRGRSAPYWSFSGNSARTVSFSVTLHADLCVDESLLSLVNKMRRMEYPRYVSSIVTPPYYYVKFGSMVGFYAICESVGVTWSGNIIDGCDYYSQAEVSFDFQELILDKIPKATRSDF